MSANHEQTVPLEQMSTVELTMWLQSKGFGANALKVITNIRLCVRATVTLLNRTRKGW